MLKVKNGRLVASNMSFALPEDFNLVLKMPGGGCHLLEFESEKDMFRGGRICIDIEFEDAEETAKEAMETFAADCDLDIHGDFKEVTRGKGTAVAAHYYGAGYSDSYEERYDFPRNRLKQNQVTVYISLMSRTKKKLTKTIFDVLDLPNVKAFLDSIEYF